MQRSLEHMPEIQGQEQELSSPAGARPRSGFRWRLCLIVGALLTLVGAQTAAASGAGVIEVHERELRADLAWLVDRRVLSLPLTTWPLPMFTVQAAIARVQAADLSPADRAALERTRRALERIVGPVTVAASFNTARHPSLDGQTSARARSELSLALSRFDENSAVRLRVSKQNAPLQDPSPSVLLDRSYLAVAPAQTLVMFGSPDRWWGPGIYASPILSDAASPIPSLLVRRMSDTAPTFALLEWLGPWGYEVSVGRLQNYTPSGSRTIGLRIFSRPLSGLEIGASRFITWAGEGRPQGPRALFNALAGRSNTDDPVGNPDPSNELAGYDLRISLPTATGAWSGYAHVIGEDEANHRPSHFIGTLGTQYKHALGEHRLEWSAESTDTELGRLFGLKPGVGPAYRHSTYVDGYFHRGLPIGATIGGGGISVTLGAAWVAPPGHPLDRVSLSAIEARLNQYGADPGNAAFGAPSRLRGLSFRVQSAGRVARWHMGLSMQRDTAAVRRELGVVGGIEVALDSPH
jgi:Capsule assembly protein Wzi